MNVKEAKTFKEAPELNYQVCYRTATHKNREHLITFLTSYVSCHTKMHFGIAYPKRAQKLLLTTSTFAPKLHTCMYDTEQCFKLDVNVLA